MKITISYDSVGSEFVKVTKYLRDVYTLPIDTAHNNPIIDTRIYDIEYVEWFKNYVLVNIITHDLFVYVYTANNMDVFFMTLSSIALIEPYIK